MDFLIFFACDDTLRTTEWRDASFSLWGPSDEDEAVKCRCQISLSLAVSPYSRTLCSAAAGQLHGENLFLLSGGGREGP